MHSDSSKFKRCLLLLAFFAAGFGQILVSQTVTLRMAANVPANSPWDIGLRRMAADFDRISDGKVKVVFPQSAHVSTEADTIQKMRFGIDAALLTAFGIADLYPDSLIISLPGYIRNDTEFDAAMTALKPLIEKKLGDRYVVLTVTRGGWVRYFSRSKILQPSDVVGQRMLIDPSDTKLLQLMQAAGARVVKGTASDFVLQINSNEVDGCTASPILVASLWSQLRGKIAYMSSYKVAPFLGAIIVNKSSWDRIPADIQPKLVAEANQLAAQISADGSKLEDQAIASLDGISAPAQSPAQAKLWADFIASQRRGLIAGMFSPDVLDAVDAAVAKVRD